MRRYTSEVGLRPAEGGRSGVLMVLHADGSTREAALDGEWAGLAASMGAALVAPSAPHARGPEPADGFDWNSAGTEEAVPAFEQRTRLIGVLSEFVESHDVDRERVIVVGEGSAARLAFDLALHAPGLVRGVLLIHGPADAEGATRRVRVAAALGMRAAFALESGAGPDGIAPDLDPQEYARALLAWWRRCGLESPMGSEPYLAPPGTAARRTRLGEVLNALGLESGRGVGATAPGAQD